MFQKEPDLVDMLFSKMELKMYDPEETVIRQGQNAN